MEVGFKSRVAGMISALPASPVRRYDPRTDLDVITCDIDRDLSERADHENEHGTGAPQHSPLRLRYAPCVKNVIKIL